LGLRSPDSRRSFDHVVDYIHITQDAPPMTAFGQFCAVFDPKEDQGIGVANLSGIKFISNGMSELQNAGRRPRTTSDYRRLGRQQRM
jgi:hypothetical protein